MTTPVNITLNGRALVAQAGQTVMQAAEAAGIEIPGLCHHPQLKPEGACRLCLVEIEKQRALQPACTFPVTEGMIVRTETDKVRAARTFALQMIFSERSHYCMICPKSGDAEHTDCELQRLGYRYGLAHWDYEPDYAKPWPIDASRECFVMDHARCILCRRCVRACNDLVANHTLGIHQRGARAMIGADDDVPFGESSCISCGTCLQVCPTGALSDRRSSFGGHMKDATCTPAVCLGCAVACRTHVWARDNQLLRVDGAWDGPSGGLLCAAGRFESIAPPGPRVLWPLVRQDGKLIETSWDKALGTVAEHFAKARRVTGLVTPRLPNESLAAVACFFDEVLQSNELALLYGAVPALDLGQRAILKDVGNADCLVVIAADPLQDHPVVGYLIRRAVEKGAVLLVVSDAATQLDDLATERLELKDMAGREESPSESLRTTYHLSLPGLARLKSLCEAGQRPVVCYGPGLSTTVYNALRGLAPTVRFLPLPQGTNALGAAKLGLHDHPVWGEARYVHLGDDQVAAECPMPERGYTVVQAAYESAWTAAADVVLPALTWAEQAGHIVNLEGRVLSLKPLVPPPRSVHKDAEALLRLAVRMGYPMAFDQLSSLAAGAR